MVNKLIALFAALLWPTIAIAGFPSGGRYTPAGGPTTTFNLITDAGATCNGVADDGPAFNAQAGFLMRQAQLTQPGVPVLLIIPSGSNCLLKTCPTASDGGKAFGGVQNLTILATGASITTFSDAGNCGIYRGSVINPWTADIILPNTPGNSCVTMKVPGAEANYPVGRWILIGGEGVQVNSFPPNYVVFEYLKVATNTGGQLCFTTPVQNFYPNDATAGIDLNGQNCSNMYCGGPGGISLMGADWGSYFNVIGGTWDFHKNSGSVHWSGVQVTFTNVTFLGDPVNNQPNACWFPTFIGTVTFNNTVFNRCNMEVDKEIDQMIFNGGNVSQGGSLNIQSPSLHSFTLNNGATLGLFGTAPLTTCNNSTLTLNMGTTYGTPPQKFVGLNCTFSINPSQAANQTGAPDGVILTYASGVFTIHNRDICASLPQWVSIGGRLAMGLGSPFPATFDADNYFTITAMTFTGTPGPPYVGPGCNGDFVITTNLPLVGAPPPSTAYDGSYGWHADQARDISCSGCIPLNPYGPNIDRQAHDLNFPAAQGKPLMTYFNRTYTCANNIANVPGSFDINISDGAGASNLNGSLEGFWTGSLTINVITADTNPSDSGGAFFGYGSGQLFNPTTGATSFFHPADNLVNVIHAGIRTVPVSGSPTGGQAGDTLTATPFGTNTWVGGGGGGAGGAAGITNGPAAQCPVVQIISQTTR